MIAALICLALVVVGLLLWCWVRDQEMSRVRKRIEDLEAKFPDLKLKNHIGC